MADHEWHPVTKTVPCPICGKPDWCARAATDNGGEIVRCMRESTAPDGYQHIREHADGGTLFGVVRDSPMRSAGGAVRYPHPKPAPTPTDTSGVDLATLTASCEERIADDQRTALAFELGVSVEAVRGLGIGWIDGSDLKVLGAGWKGSTPTSANTIPERDRAGAIVGFSLRATDGQ